MCFSDRGNAFFLESIASHTAGAGSWVCFDVGHVGGLRGLRSRPLRVAERGRVITGSKRGSAQWCIMWPFFNRWSPINFAWRNSCCTRGFFLKYEANRRCVCIRINFNWKCLRCNASHFIGRLLQKHLKYIFPGIYACSRATKNKYQILCFFSKIFYLISPTRLALAPERKVASYYLLVGGKSKESKHNHKKYNTSFFEWMNELPLRRIYRNLQK